MRPPAKAPILQQDDKAEDVATASVDYNTFTVAELKREIKSKGLKQRGIAKLKKK